MINNINFSNNRVNLKNNITFGNSLRQVNYLRPSGGGEAGKIIRENPGEVMVRQVSIRKNLATVVKSSIELLPELKHKSSNNNFFTKELGGNGRRMKKVLAILLAKI